jgi:2-methylcitrate dehydratase PrpD
MDVQIPLVEDFAHYGIGLEYGSIPSDALEIAKRLVFDTLGTGLGGYRDPLGKKAVTFAAEHVPGNVATVLGDRRLSSMEGAAFANGTMVKILGMDDSHRRASHIAAQVIPAALAVGEMERTSGKDLLVALVAAYDLAVRVGRAVRQSQRERGLDLKGTVGPMAGALAAGLCMGLDEESLSHAIALGANMGSGTEQYVYDRGKCDTKDLLSGFAARNAVFAARLAREDFYGPRGALDGEYGFFRAFGDGFDAVDFSDLGDDFLITTTAFKPHGGCRHTHQAVDAVQAMLEECDVDPTEIDRIKVRTYGYATRPSFRVDADPGSRELAGLSIRVATAVAIVRGSAWPEDYEYWDDRQVRRLRHLIDVEIDPEIEAAYPDRNGCRVIVTLKDGQVYEGYTPYAKGEPELRMTDAELQEKFSALAEDILPAGRLEELFERCMNLEKLRDVGALTRSTVVVR